MLPLAGGAKRIGVAKRLPVDRQARRLAHALVGKRRFRVPHIEKVEKKGADAAEKDQLQIRVVLIDSPSCPSSR